MPGQVNIVVKDEKDKVLRAGENVPAVREWLTKHHTIVSENTQPSGKIIVVVAVKGCSDD